MIPGAIALSNSSHLPVIVGSKVENPVLDEFTHECLAIRVARKLKAIDVIDVLSDLFILRGIPAHIRSDNGPSR